MARLLPLFSSSGGNSYYISGNSQAVIVDAGRSCRQIENALLANDLDMSNVGAIFITHEHTDHCSALRVLAKRYKLKVYATNGTLEALIRQNRLDEKTDCEVIENSVTVGDMCIRRVKTSHDAAESCGYFITTADDRKCAIVTDTGFFTDDAKDAIMQSNMAVVESNHDIDMLKNGMYPYVLKRRILSSTGHMSNPDCAQCLPDFVRAGVTRFLLAHLSRENNTPSLALSTALCALENASMKRDEDFTIDTAPVETNGKSIIF